jgi:hypothetical protein
VSLFGQKSLELGKVEIEWILDEDLWKTLYNKNLHFDQSLDD